MGYPTIAYTNLREWLTRHTRLRSGDTGVGGVGAPRLGRAGVTSGAGSTGGAAATGPGGARTRGTGAAGTSSVGGTGAGVPGASGAEAGAGDTGDVDLGAGGVVSGGTGAVGTLRPRQYFVLELPTSTGLTPPFQSQPPLPPAPRLPAPSPNTEQTGGLIERHEPASRPVSPVRPARRAPRPRPPPVPGTHSMALRPSSVPLRVSLPPPLASSLPVVIDPDFESAAASALVAELLDFAADFRLDYATALIAESESTSPPSIGGECALGTDVLEDGQEDFECLAAAVPHLLAMLLAPEGDPDAPDIPTPRSYTEVITGPYSSQWQTAMDAEMASWKSTGTYVDVVPPSRVNILDGMWILRVKRPSGSPPAFKARYVARGFSPTFSRTPKMTTLWVLLHVAAQRDYELQSLDFSTAFLQGSLHEEIWQRRPPGFTGSFPASTQWSLRWPVYGLRHAPREWHDTRRTTIAALGFTPSTADPSVFLRTDTSLPPFYVLMYVDDLVFATADTEALTLVKSELQKRHTCTDLGPSALWLPVLLATAHSSVYQPLALSSTFRQVLGTKRCTRMLRRGYCVTFRSTSGMGLVLGGWGPVVLTGHADASCVDDSTMQRSSQGYTFSLGSGSVSWRSTRSSSVLSSSCEADIYAGDMAAQELRWLTYLLTDLGEQPRSPLCGQLRLAYVATRANTANVFTKALAPSDHQRFSTVLGLKPTLPHLLIA
ncbi:unnamed protein product [Closterium sp. NIES-53]